MPGGAGKIQLRRVGWYQSRASARSAHRAAGTILADGIVAPPGPPRQERGFLGTAPHLYRGTCNVFLELDGNGPRYSQLTRALKQAILRGQLKAGSRLPATRALASELGLSRNTVLTAYESLCAEQLAVAAAGSGTFVRRVMMTGGFAAEAPEVPPQTRYAARLRSLAA